MSSETNLREVQVVDSDGRENGFLTAEEAAKLLVISPATLADWRKRARLAGPPFVKVGPRAVRYSVRALEKWLAKRTVRPLRSTSASAPFYRLMRIEKLGAKHPGLLKFVEKSMRARLPYPEIAAAIHRRWGESVSTSVLSNYYVRRLWPRMCDEERRRKS